MPVAASLANLKVRTKILSGFSCVLAIFAVVGISGLITLMHINDGEKVVEQRSEISDIAGAIELKFLSARRLVREFAHAGDPTLGPPADVALAAVKDEIDHALSEMKNGDLHTKVQEISESVQNYTQSFQRVKTEMLSMQSLWTQVVDASGLKLRRDFDDLTAAAAKSENTSTQILTLRGLEALMGARLDANKAYARHDENQTRQADESFLLLGQALQRLEPAVQDADMKPLFEDIKLLTERYSAAAHQALALSRAVYALVDGDMASYAARITNEAEAIKGSARKDQLTAQSSIGSAIAFGTTFSVGLLVTGIALGVILAWIIASVIVRPLLGMTLVMGNLADGDISVDVPGVGRTDEIGAMANAVEVFKQNAIENRALTAATARDRAARDRRQAAMDSYTLDFGITVAGVMTNLGQSATRMHAAAHEMATAAKRTRASTANAVEGANTSARDLHSVAVAAEEMTASIHEISRQVSSVTSAVSTAVRCASETDAKVAGLATTADRIGDVVRLISDIAGQTNLLALNATIEAARAGEAGKGFAVVASEVKALASQTARATEQIGSQIIAIRSASEDAVEAVREVGAAIGQVDAVATAIATAVEQQALATQEISGSVQIVTQATTTTAEAMGQVLIIAEQTDLASAAVLTAANDVSNTSATLHTEVDDFLGAMKAADTDDRRTFERVSGGGASVTVGVVGQGEVRARLKDISRGGAGLECGLTERSGTEVRIGFPTGETVPGRVVGSGGGILQVSFRQDADSLGKLSRMLTALEQSTRSTAA